MRFLRRSSPRSNMEEETKEREGTARPMSREDVHDYHGITLTEDGREEEREMPRSGIHFHVFSLSAIPWWKKVLWGAALAGAVVVLLALAWFLMIGAVVAAGALLLLYLVKRFFMK